MRVCNVCIIGEPNIGKSTLFNRLAGRKISAVTNVKGTTRSALKSEISFKNVKINFIDTPGVTRAPHLLNKLMMNKLQSALASASCVIAMVPPNEYKGFFHPVIKEIKKNLIIAVNKTDKLKDKKELLPLINYFNKEFKPGAVVPLSALKDKDFGPLLKTIINYSFDVQKLKNGAPSNKALLAEIIRENIFKLLREELPHNTDVIIENTEEKKDITVITAAVIASKPSYKPIIVGKGGGMIKKISTRSREAMEKLINKKVYLDLNVKVEEDWKNSLKILKRMYSD